MADINELRATYQTLTGKNAFNGWSAEDLERRIGLINQAETNETRRAVRITAGHVYLPLDGDGNVPVDWLEAQETVRVEGGTVLLMPDDLLATLPGRAEAA